MKPNSKHKTANLRLSALIPKTGREEGDVIFPPRIQMGKTCHQRRLAVQNWSPV